MVSDPATLTIGNIRKSDERSGMGDGVCLLDSITNCVDSRIVRLIRRIHSDAATRSQVQSSEFGQSDIRPYADGTDHEVGSKAPTVGKGDRPVLDRCDGRTRLDVDAMRNQFVAHQHGPDTTR